MVGAQQARGEEARSLEQLVRVFGAHDKSYRYRTHPAPLADPRELGMEDLISVIELPESVQFSHCPASALSAGGFFQFLSVTRKISTVCQVASRTVWEKLTEAFAGIVFFHLLTIKNAAASYVS